MGLAIFLRQLFQKGGFATVFPHRPFSHTSSHLATRYRLSRSWGYARSLGSFTIIVDLKMCTGNFTQRTRIFFNRQKEEKEKRPATSTGRLLSPTPRMQLTKHHSCFTDYLRELSATFISTGVTSPTAGRTGYKRHSLHL